MIEAGDILDEAMDNAREAIKVWLEVAIDDGMPMPEATSLAAHQANAECAGWTWALVTVDLASLSDKPKRAVNPY